MKPVSLKQKFACALVLPLLGLLGLVLRNASSHSFTPASTSKPTVSVRSLEPKATTTAAIHQLKLDGSYDSLQQAFQAALAQPESVRTTPADIVNATHTMATPWRGLRSYFGPDTVHIRPSRKGGEAWKWDARLISYGYGANQQAVEQAQPVPVKNGIEYRRGSLTEWYINDQRGLEQGFTLATRPASDAKSQDSDSGPLTLTVAIDSDLTPKLNQTADSIAFIGQPGEPVLHYAGLLAWVADGRRLPAHIELRREGALALLVDDRTAKYPVTIDPLIFVETKLVAPDVGYPESFGTEVAISGDTIVVGAPADTLVDDALPGSAYVFVRSGTAWSFQARLHGDATDTRDAFGEQVAISGDTAAIAAARENAVYVFVRSGSAWTLQQKILSDGPALEFFGSDVSIDGDTLVIGARGNSIDLGAAYVFVRTGALWTQQQKLSASDLVEGGLFGIAVSVKGDTLVVGASLADVFPVDSCGAAYVFERTGSNWSELDRILAQPPVTNDRFGSAVSIGDDDTIIVGAQGRDTATTTVSGSAFVFARVGAQWQFQQELMSDPPSSGANFGLSVAIKGDTLVVGSAAVAAFVFTRNGAVWTRQAKLVPSDDNEFGRFGHSVDTNGDAVVVGNQTFRNSIGSAYVYDNASQADLLVSQAADKTTVKQNETLTYTITVRNFGANRAANVKVDDTLPAGSVFKNAHANKGQFTAPPLNQTGVVTWYLGDMLNGDQEDAQLVVTVTIKGKATLTNTVAVQSDTFDPNLANNTTTLATSVGSGSSGGGGKK